MSGIFTRIGSLISGIHEKLAGVDNTILDITKYDIQPEPQQSINEAGEIEDNMDDVEELEAPSMIETPSRFGFGSILSRFRRPIDIIISNIPTKKDSVTPLPESPAESSS